MRLVIMTLTAMATSTVCVALLFVYALTVPTLPAPSAAIVSAPDSGWTGGPRRATDDRRLRRRPLT
ncbi:MAG: hypothetical protein WDN31_02870 [Hyphomicrobium sp.]